MPEMNTPMPSPESPQRQPAPGMFAEPGAAAGKSFPTAAVGLAVVAVLILLAALIFLGRHKAGAPGTDGAAAMSAAYAGNVKLDGVEMSESTNMAGSKDTYLDGKITNSGPSTVTAVRVTVAFASDGGGSQTETVPVNLIRMRQPEVDTEPVSAEPIAPGATKEFRLIFDDIKPEWNQQTPEIRVTGVVTR